jgi:DNA-3-methyladenine glycosylase II
VLTVPHASRRALAATPPFDIRRSLAFLETFKPIQGEQDLGDNWLRRAIATPDGRAAVYELREHGGTDAPSLELTVWADDDVVDDVASRVSTFLSLDDDLGPFYAIAADDPKFAPIVEQLRGLHHVKFPSGFEAACWAVLVTRSPLPVARKMKRALTERYGTEVDLDGTNYPVFPTCEQLAGASEDDLVDLTGNRRRASFLKSVVDHWSVADEAWLRSAPWEEAEAWLRQIKGVGEWCASFVLLRGLGRMEQMPLTMKPMIQAAEAVYGRQDAIERVSERYGDWLGYWAFYLRVAEGQRAHLASA